MEWRDSEAHARPDADPLRGTLSGRHRPSLGQGRRRPRSIVLIRHRDGDDRPKISQLHSMARELGRDGITVNAILPGAISTEIQRKTVTPDQKQRIVAMQCIPRPEVPEDLVGTVLFLASDASAFLTGQAPPVDGGATPTCQTEWLDAAG